MVRRTLSSWFILPLLSIVSGTAFGQADDARLSGAYRIPSYVRTVAALSKRVSSMTPAVVERIVDGDTIVVSFRQDAGSGFEEKVRLIGVDTPETVDPRRPVERFGEEASRFAEGRLLGRTVRLAFEASLRDRYGRLLAYVFLEDGTCFNLAIVAEGYGFAYTKYPFPFMGEFRKAERAARDQERGLWAGATGSMLEPGYRLVEGHHAAAAPVAQPPDRRRALQYVVEARGDTL